MKIVRIIARLNVGGPARHVVWLTSRLQSEEFQSTLIAGSVPPGEEDMSYFASQHGVTPVYVEELSRELSPKDLVSLFKIFAEIRRQRPDIIHTHTAKAGTLGRTAAFLYRWITPGTLVGRPRKVKVVHTFHGHVFHSYYSKMKTSVFKGIERMLARFATDRIVVISDQQLNEISRETRIGKTSQFRVIPLGIEFGRLETTGKSNLLRREIGVSPDAIVVAFIGRLTEIKDVPLLLNAFAENTDVPMHLAIIGDGHLREDLKALSIKNGTASNVHFLGNREDVLELVAGVDIVALTSLNEGTPLSLIEAMAAGKPVITTTVGGVVDLLGTKEEDLGEFSIYERGIGVESRDPSHFCKGLIYLAKNERLRKSLGSAGQAFVREHYSIDRLERDISELYRELMSSYAEKCPR